MKKLVMMLAVAASMSLVSCGTKAEENKEAENTEAQQTEAEAPAAEATVVEGAAVEGDSTTVVVAEGETVETPAEAPAEAK